MAAADDDFDRLASAVAARLGVTSVAQPESRSASTAVIDRLANAVARRLVALTEEGVQGGRDVEGAVCRATVRPNAVEMTVKEGLDSIAKRILSGLDSNFREELPLESIEI